MSMAKYTIRRYAFALCGAIALLSVAALDKDIGVNALSISLSSFKQMLTVLPPVMILISLMDVWIPREAMMKYMGEGSGLLGVVLAMVIGTLGAGPMYAAFPFAIVLLKKGVKFSNVIIFMNAWCVTKISTFLYELTALGLRFTLTRLALDIPGVIVMGYMVEKFMKKSELDKIYHDVSI